MNTSTKLKPGQILVEIVFGVEGSSLYIGNGEIGERVSGNKPWGGGRTTHAFQVDVEELVRLAKRYGLKL